MKKTMLIIGIGLAGLASVFSQGSPCVSTDKVPNMLGLNFVEALIMWHEAGFHGPMIVDRCCSKDLICVAQSIPPFSVEPCDTPVGLTMRLR